MCVGGGVIGGVEGDGGMGMCVCVCIGVLVYGYVCVDVWVFLSDVGMRDRMRI